MLQKEQFKKYQMQLVNQLELNLKKKVMGLLHRVSVRVQVYRQPLHKQMEIPENIYITRGGTTNY